MRAQGSPPDLGEDLAGSDEGAVRAQKGIAGVEERAVRVGGGADGAQAIHRTRHQGVVDGEALGNAPAQIEEKGGGGGARDAGRAVDKHAVVG